MNRSVTFSATSLKEFTDWVAKDKKIAEKILDLIKDIQRDSFKGIGKPEPLKGDFSGFWSRRITQEHRLIYKVTPTTIEIYQYCGHYET